MLGHLEISPRTEGGLVAHIDRPLLGSMLRGREAHHLSDWVYALGGICVHAHALAAKLALSAAQGQTLSAAQLGALPLQVQLESLREHSVRLLLDWPAVVELAPQVELLGQFNRQLLAFHQEGLSWLGRQRLERIVNALDQHASTQWLMCRHREGRYWRDVPYRALEESALPQIGEAMYHDDRFCLSPRFEQKPCHTGALALHRTQFAEQLALLGPAPSLHLEARWYALQQQVQGLGEDGALPWGQNHLDRGIGLGWVHGARGWLVHCVEVADERLVNYHVLAPTEWNFHPQGLLSALPDADREGARMQALMLALDPCVPWRSHTADTALQQHA